MAYLVIKTGEHEGARIPLSKSELTFGRSDECDVVLDDRNISRHHAKCVLLDENRTALWDLGSSNGTFVNNLPISRVFLMDGDDIRMGETVIEYYEEPPAETEKEKSDRKGIQSIDRPILPKAPSGGGTAILTLPENISHAEALKETYLQLRTLYRMISDMNTSENLAELFRRLGSSLLISLGVDRVAFFLKNTSDKEMILKSSSLNPAIKEKGFNEKHPFAEEMIKCIQEERVPYLFTESLNAEETSATMLAAPIIKDQKLLGLITADNPESHKSLSKTDLDFVQSAAEQLSGVISRLSSFEELKKRNRRLQKVVDGDVVIVCRDPKMLDILDSLNRLGMTESAVLIRGESGTGKELIARTIHSYSPRRNQPMVSLNCASIPETLIESELFGHERGAFTGAVSRKPGRFEQANGGTLFLDEIGDMPLSAQAKLLRTLQSGEVHRVGGTGAIHVDVRIITATNKDLIQYINEGKFREDLYYRIKVVELTIPPLRERREDILILAEYFLLSLRKKIATSVVDFSQDAMDLLVKYSWPGNVRELKNVVERALVFAGGTRIMPEHLPGELHSDLVKMDTREEEHFPDSLAGIEKNHIIKTMEYTKGNKLKAAEILGISRSTLYEKIKQYEIKS